MHSDGRALHNLPEEENNNSDDNQHTNPQQHQPVGSSTGPPLFDGSVANARGCASTIMHLACALDVPLALAFLLAMGADARASHTAFRRLMVHEAACNGSIQCLALLLELGEKFGQERRVPNLASTLHLPFLPRRIDRSQALAPIHVMAQHPALLLSGNGVKNGGQTDFVSMLRLFRQMSQEVVAGRIPELDAARQIMKQATQAESSQVALAQACGFDHHRLVVDSIFVHHRSFRETTGGSSDGHGNTPLRWAAFKNETECVSLLLRFNADANARAQPVSKILQ